MFAANEPDPEPSKPGGREPRGPAATDLNGETSQRFGFVRRQRLEANHEDVRKTLLGAARREVAESVAAPLPPRDDFPKPQKPPAEGIVRQDQIHTNRRLVAHQRDLVVKWVDCQETRQVADQAPNFRGR